MKHLSITNWSLRKTLQNVPDNFTKAQVRIIFTILLFALVKVLVVLCFGFVHEQSLQTIRALAGLVIYVTLIKLLLSRPDWLKPISHVMLVAGLVLVCMNIYFIAHKINLVTVQFVFMMIISSFYALNNRWGIIYSVLGTLPVVIFLLFNYETGDGKDKVNELISPGYEIVVILNFITIAIAHYLFYKAFRENINEKDELNKDLQKSIAEARQLAASKTNFLSTMSHELRTPLNSVIGITELLLKDKPAEHQHEKLKILQSSTVDLLALINNVLDINKLDSEKLQLEEAPFELKEFMQKIISTLKVKAASKQLWLSLTVDERLDGIYVVSDATRLAQVIYNLVGNAIKFTEHGNIKVEVARKDDIVGKIVVAFSVEDTGIGIPRSKHNEIFEIFSQAESNTARKYGGTGLGLPIVKQVLRLFRSSVQVHSIPGEGSRFSFRIAFTTTEDHGLAESNDVTMQKDLSHLKILIAEDNDVNKFILQQQMEAMNISPVIVNNGQQAYDTWLKNNFDAVLLDLHMPVLDGYDASKKIRAAVKHGGADVFLIAYTASVTEQQRIIEHGFNDFLYKPARMDDLREKLEKVATRKESALNIS
jgi:signal transduction histidine kinase/ActR/RegA family two-component response regulator